MEKKTPLYELHAAAGGKLVPFAGYLLPIQYSGILAEHQAVRTHAGLFDVSHMGELMLSGPGALNTVQQLLTNDFSTLEDGQVRYSPMCREDGGILDDLLVYRLDAQRYLLVVNAANHDRDAAWVSSHLLEDTRMEDQSEETAQLALQGPGAEKILTKLVDRSQLPEKYYTFRRNVPLCGYSCLVSRTGYTGEDGFEIYCENAAAPVLWKALLDAGAADGLIPCGLGARDTLRTEAAMPLYGHEMTEEITPYEAGLSIFVKPDKGAFIGRDALASKTPPARRRCGLKVTGRGIPREGCAVSKDGAVIGCVTSGTQSAVLGCPVALALVTAGAVSPGDQVEIDVRGRAIGAEVVKLPFYKRSK